MSDNSSCKDSTSDSADDEDIIDLPPLSSEIPEIYSTTENLISEICDSMRDDEILPDYDSFSYYHSEELIDQNEEELTTTIVDEDKPFDNDKLAIPSNNVKKVIERDNTEEIIRALNSLDYHKKVIKNIPLYGKERRCCICRDKYDMNFTFCYSEDETLYSEEKPFICYWCSLYVENFRMIRDWENPKKAVDPIRCYRCRCMKSRCRIKYIAGKQNPLCTYCSIKTKRRYERSKESKNR